MSEKQIFAALEVSDHEIRLVIGEFFNTRFNIIKVERIPCDGLSYDRINDPDAVISGIKAAVTDAEAMIKAAISKVILAVPSYKMRRYSVTSTVPIEGIEGTVTMQDVQNAQRKVQTVKIDPNLALVQVQPIKYWVHGISSRRIPVGERTSELAVDIDLLCADMPLIYELVGCVEKSGLQVMDIFLDVFAVGNEAALFEQSVEQNIIVLKMERQSTTLGLISGGRLNQCVVIPSGVGEIAGVLVDKYDLNRDHAVELVKYSALLSEKVHSSNPVHIRQDGQVTKKLTEAELVESIMPEVDKWIETMAKMCGGILQAGRTTVIITGEGGEMQGLNELLHEKLGCEVRNYIPETLGGRNAGLSACLGLFYAYKDRLPITGYLDSSLDLDQFLNEVSYRDKDAQNNGQSGTLTRKIKDIFNGKK